MQEELRETNPDLNIEILGVNQIGDSASNPIITAGRALPWLQDTAQDGVWNRWQVVYRDVRILDSQNQIVAVYNLTSNDLAKADRRAALKELFLKAAQAIDSDKDGLPDDWEIRYLGNLSAGPQDDSDQDGIDNFNEFAFGANPNNSRSLGGMRVTLNRPSAQIPVSVSFRRRAGSLVEYSLEISPDLREWTPATPATLAGQPPRNLFDGTGLSEMFFFPTSTALANGPGFFRVRLAPKEQP